MRGANTRSVLARFGDNNWEKGEDFVKIFYVKKLVWEMEGSLSARARWMTCKTVRSCCEKQLRQNFAKVAKFLWRSQSIQTQIRPSCGKNLSTSFCACLVSWKQGNSEIPANIGKSCRRPVVSLLYMYATKSALTAPFSSPEPTIFLACGSDRELCRRPERLWALGTSMWLLRICWAWALASPVTFLTGSHEMQIGFGQISPSASSSRDLGARLSRGN